MRILLLFLAVMTFSITANAQSGCAVWNNDPVTCNSSSSAQTGFACYHYYLAPDHPTNPNHPLCQEAMECHEYNTQNECESDLREIGFSAGGCVWNGSSCYEADVSLTEKTSQDSDTQGLFSNNSRFYQTTAEQSYEIKLSQSGSTRTALDTTCSITIPSASTLDCSTYGITLQSINVQRRNNTLQGPTPQDLELKINPANLPEIGSYSMTITAGYNGPDMTLSAPYSRTINFIVNNVVDFRWKDNQDNIVTELTMDVGETKTLQIEATNALGTMSYFRAPDSGLGDTIDNNTGIVTMTPRLLEYIILV